MLGGDNRMATGANLDSSHGEYRLQRHAEWAAQCRAAGVLISSGNPSRGRFPQVLCPALGGELLRLHDGGAGANLAKPGAQHKGAAPTKGLLTEALTVVSGEAWSRQRPAVVAAAGGGPSAQSARHRDAVREAVELAVELAGSCHGEGGGGGRAGEVSEARHVP